MPDEPDLMKALADSLRLPDDDKCGGGVGPRPEKATGPPPPTPYVPTPVHLKALLMRRLAAHLAAVKDQSEGNR